MNALRLKVRLESATLTLSSPELKAFIGKDVEVFVVEKEPEKPPAGKAESGYGSMKGTILRYDDPLEPALPTEEWEAFN